MDAGAKLKIKPPVAYGMFFRGNYDVLGDLAQPAAGQRVAFFMPVSHALRLCRRAFMGHRYGLFGTVGDALL